MDDIEDHIELEGNKDCQVRTERLLRASRCRGLMRKALIAEFDSIVKGFVEEAKRGSAAHVRLANELLEPPSKAKSRRKGTAQRLVEDWDKL